MQKKLTITLDEAVYHGLYRRVGARNISQFIERLVRPHVVSEELDASYEAMASDTEREEAALAWSEALLRDAADDPELPR